MIHYDKVMKTLEYKEFVGITCSVCKTFYKAEDTMELQEFHHINFTGGYASVFGDMSEIRCNICQRCLEIMIGDYVEEVDDEN